MNPIRNLKNLLKVEFALWNDIQDYLLGDDIPRARNRLRKYNGNNYHWHTVCYPSIDQEVWSLRHNAKILLFDKQIKNDKIMFEKCLKNVSKLCNFYDECLTEMELVNKHFICVKVKGEFNASSS